MTEGRSGGDRRPREGFFLSFEGIDGCGKSTQAQLLADRLAHQGVNAVTAREPGGTAVGDLVRDLLLGARGLEMEPMTELLLFFASRSENVRRVIRPALRAGRVVICDRFADASVAYQGYGRRLGPGVVHELGSLVLGGFRPDLTVWLDIPPRTALARARSRATANSGPGDRMESQGADFFRRVRDGYAAIAADDPSRVVRIDATGSERQVGRRVYRAVRPALRAREYPLDQH